MKTSEVITYYGNQMAVAAAIRRSQSEVSRWGEFPPPDRQVLIQRLTRGKLKAEPGSLDRAIGLDRLKAVS